MTTTSVEAEIPTDIAVDLPPADLTTVPLDELIVGRTLTTPIYDESGVLLLATGCVLTAEFKRLLKQRGEGAVRMTANEASRLSFSAAAVPDINIKLETQLADQLDKLIDSGLLDVSNSGPAAKQRLVYHGRKAYSIERHAALQDQRTAAAESLGSMMKEALHGRTVASTAVTKMAAEFLSDLADDSDCTLNVALAASQDAELSQHSLRMATLGMAIAVEMGLDEDHCKRVCVAGLVHDWGMAKVPDELRKTSRVLSEHEMFQIKKHPIHTLEMLERMPGIPAMVPMIAYQVHEQPNGRGYPRGRSGERTLLFARILGVADAYAALTESRPHRPALSPYAAMECILKMASRRELDAQVARALLLVMTLFPIGSYVSLSDGSVARVIRRNGDKYTLPFVQIVQDAAGQPVPTDRDDAVVDLSADSRYILQALPMPGSQESGDPAPHVQRYRPLV
jgi:HD-GYP domain-containing protein (c-di-GMP phosphodiesterase class II)